MKLVINGDDLGYTLANTLGIIEAYRNGILRSTTALANAKYIEQAVEMTKDCTDLGIGAHLTLTYGKPLTENKTLHDENGCFFNNRTLFQKQLDDEEIYLEWKAQIERFIELFGRKPTHLDSHHNIHYANEQLSSIAKQLGKEYGLEIRKYGHFRLVDGFYGADATKEQLLKMLTEHLDEDIEIMTHPGYCDLELYRLSSYALIRVKELDILCDDEVKQFLQDHHIETTHY
ncbi:MAG: carbohydrate deacetylase [Oscillospiraceae bacterium]|nr:carbohydrate deacetylase [Oscillospiraceae bacterium]